MPEFKVSPELKEKLKAEATDYHEVSDGRTDYIHFHLDETPSKPVLELLLQSIKETADQAWELFQAEENVSKLLDIVGTTLYTLNLTYDVNMRTLRKWHKNLHEKPLSNDVVNKMVDDINKTMSEFLGRPVDIEKMSTDEMDAIVEEASQQGLNEGLNVLSKRLDRTAEEN